VYNIHTVDKGSAKSWTTAAVHSVTLSRNYAAIHRRRVVEGTRAPAREEDVPVGGVMVYSCVVVEVVVVLVIVVVVVVNGENFTYVVVYSAHYRRRRTKVVVFCVV